MPVSAAASSRLGTSRSAPRDHSRNAAAPARRSGAALDGSTETLEPAARAAASSARAAGREPGCSSA